MAEAEHPAAAVVALLNLKNATVFDSSIEGVKSEPRSEAPSGPLASTSAPHKHGQNPFQGPCGSSGLERASSDPLQSLPPSKVPRFLDVMCKDNKGRYDLLAHRVICLCRDCDPGKVMSVVDYEEHSGYKQRYWKRSIRVITASGDMQLGQWLEHFGILGQGPGAGNGTPSESTNQVVGSPKDDSKKLYAAQPPTNTVRSKRTRPPSPSQPVESRRASQVIEEPDLPAPAAPANGQSAKQHGKGVSQNQAAGMGLDRVYSQPLDSRLQTYADTLLAINEKVQEYFLANVEHLSSSELRLLGKVVELNVFLCGGVAAQPEVLSLILTVQQCILEKPPTHPIVIELVVRALHVLQNATLLSAAEDVIMLMRLLLKQLENPNSIIIANCCSFNLLYMQVCAESGCHVDLANVAKNVYRLEDVLLKPAPISDEQAAFIEKSVESNFAKLKLLLSKAV